MKQLRVLNDTGISLLGEPADKIQDIRVYPENGSIQMWVLLSDGTEVLQYLSAKEAMAFAVVFERLAIETFRQEARNI